MKGVVPLGILNHCNMFKIGPIQICVKYTTIHKNIHRHRNLKNIRNTDDSRYETFITFLTFRFSTRGEGDTIITMLTVPSNPTTCGASRRPNWTDVAQVQKSTRFVQLQISTHCFFFQKSPKTLSPSLPGMTSFTFPVISSLGFLLWHLWLSHPPRVSVNTCAQCVPLPVH